jgi:hypothetical protein
VKISNVERISKPGVALLAGGLLLGKTTDKPQKIFFCAVANKGSCQPESRRYAEKSAEECEGVGIGVGITLGIGSGFVGIKLTIQ